MNSNITKRVTEKKLPVSSGTVKWFDIDWQRANAEVKQCQQRIAVAYSERNMDMDMEQISLVKRLQEKLVKSFSRKRIAVKTVSTNKGKNTPGVDGIIWNSPESKMKAVMELNPVNSRYKAKPRKRVYIRKKDGKLRPVSVSCMSDRAMQTVWKLALEPIAECTRDTHSYGFRQGRSTQDCQQYLWLLCARKQHPKWVLFADIKGFYENINHDWIIKNIPIKKHILKQFLNAGFMEKNFLYATERGVPQERYISPTIANMILDGLEVVVKTTADQVLKKAKKKSKT
jgi:RNA-directed DNA polymerase